MATIPKTKQNPGGIADLLEMARYHREEAKFCRVKARISWRTSYKELRKPQLIWARRHEAWARILTDLAAGRLTGLLDAASGAKPNQARSKDLWPYIKGLKRDQGRS